MASIRVKNVRIRAICSAVPSRIEGLVELEAQFGKAETLKITEATGVKQRHIASASECASDLCFKAAQTLLDFHQIDRTTVDGLIFVTQTPDQQLPATSCVLQHRLNLPVSCAAMDVGLGCSGYVYGLWLAASLIQGGGLQKVLLLAGDTISKIVSPEDRSTLPVFGDAGSATLLCADEAAAPMFFELGTDGSGAAHLRVSAGGARLPRSEQTGKMKLREGGNIRSDEHLDMNGAEVFAFTLKQVPAMLAAVLGDAGLDWSQVDALVPHQANKFMLTHLAKRMKLPEGKQITALETYGNTSSASIPLTINHALNGRLSEGAMTLALAGFGVGLSWAAAVVRLDQMALSPVVTL